MHLEYSYVKHDSLRLKERKTSPNASTAPTVELNRSTVRNVASSKSLTAPDEPQLSEPQSNYLIRGRRDEAKAIDGVAGGAKDALTSNAGKHSQSTLLVLGLQIPLLLNFAPPMMLFVLVGAGSIGFSRALLVLLREPVC